MSNVLYFLLDLILDWDEIPSYEYLVPSVDPSEGVSPLFTPSVVVPWTTPNIRRLTDEESHQYRIEGFMRRHNIDLMSEEEYLERNEPDRGEQAFERFSTYR